MQVTLENVRLSFPHFVEPDENGKYSANFIFEKDSPAYKALFEAQRNTKGRKPLRNGDDKASYAGYEGNYFCSARTQYAPRLFDAEAKATNDIGAFKSGTYVNAVVSTYEYDKGGNKGMGLCLIGVQFVKEGHFDNVEGTGESYNALFSPVNARECDNDDYPA